jgi:hypothetical protein
MSVTEVKFLQKWWRRRDIVTKHAICLQWFGLDKFLKLWFVDFITRNRT